MRRNFIEAVQGQFGGKDHAAPLVKALSLDMADYWEATPESYFV